MVTGWSKETFDIQSPSGLLLKLRYDIVRLDRAPYTLASRYAAMDCAIGSLHIIDWVLAHMTDARHQEVSGVGAGARGATAGFIKRNGHRVPDLEICDILANTAKHRVLRREVDQLLETSSSTIFDPPFPAYDWHLWNGKLRSRCFVKKPDGDREDAVSFFTRVERGWRHVLVEEGFLEAELGEQEIDYDEFQG